MKPNGKYYECVLDTNYCAALLAQYNPSSKYEALKECPLLKTNILKIINPIITEEEVENGKVVASAFAFIEILNKFTMISKARFSINKVRWFIEQPPKWFSIEGLSLDTCEKFISVPKYSIKDENIELTDAIHVATALQRVQSNIEIYFATTDHKLHDLPLSSLGITLIS
ncbi:MAG: hypothetical protein ACKVTZ_15460 [Bacteroidia bacterium]